MLPLEGILITDLSQGQQGPHATVMLSDMGARVIKVEPLQGEIARGVRHAGKGTGQDMSDYMDAYWLAHDRNKKGIALDVTREKGKEIVLKLVEKSDVFVQNFRPGVVDRLGLDYQTLSKTNPKIIYASASGFGLKGPFKNKPSLDLVAQAMGGIMYRNGTPEEPAAVGALIADQTGSMILAYGIVMALLVRERTGIAQEIDVSLLGSQLCLQSSEFTYTLLTGLLSAAAGKRTSGQGGLWYSFKAGDSKWFVIAGVDDRRWPAFCKALGIERLAADPRFASADVRVVNRGELIPILEEVFARKPREEWLKLLEEADIVNGPVYSYLDLKDHPQVIENEYVTEIEHPKRGKARVVGVPVKLSKTPGRPQASYPELGQHTTEILLELGYTPEQVGQLLIEEVVACY